MHFELRTPANCKLVTLALLLICRSGSCAAVKHAKVCFFGEGEDPFGSGGVSFVPESRVGEKGGRESDTPCTMPSTYPGSLVGR